MPTRRRRDDGVDGSRAAVGRSALAARAGAHALGEQDGLADERHAGAADEHQVGRAPERHVLAEQPVPDVVEREADQRERRRRRR